MILAVEQHLTAPEPLSSQALLPAWSVPCPLPHSLPPPFAFLVSSALWPSSGPYRHLGAATCPQGLPWLPNSAGLARNAEKKPQAGCGACFQGDGALGVHPGDKLQASRSRSGSREEEGQPFLLSPCLFLELLTIILRRLWHSSGGKTEFCLTWSHHACYFLLVLRLHLALYIGITPGRASERHM